MAKRNKYLLESDIKCVKIILPILIECAKSRKTLTYTELNDKLKDKVAKQKNQRTIGRRVEWIRCFTDPKDLPNLTSLVIRDDTGKPGEGFGTGDFKKEQKCCFACKNWHEGEIEDFLAELKSMLGLKKDARERREILKSFGVKNNL